jgi:hypothetical protein
MDGIPIKLFVLRLSAAFIDALLGLTAGFLLALGRIGNFFAERAVVMLRIGSPDTIWKGLIPMIMGILGPFVYSLPLAVFLIMLIEPLTGVSLGKRIVRLRIIPEEKVTLSSRERWARFAAKTVLFWGLVLALLLGSWVLALCSVVLGCLVLCSFLASFFFPLKPLHDLLSHTTVIKISKGK